MRFTLKTLMAAVTVTAVLCCIFFALPGIIAVPILGLFWLMAPPALIAGIVYGRGYGRAFAIGCVSAGGCIPFVWLYSAVTIFAVVGEDLSELTLDNDTALAARIAFGALFVFTGISGLMSMVVRWCSIKMQPLETKVAAPNYSVLQRRVTTVESATSGNGTDSADKEEA